MGRRSSDRVRRGRRLSANTVLQRCEVLGACSEEGDRLTRPFATESMRRAQEMVIGWMRDAGMTVRRDNIGNLRARYEGSQRGPTLLLGSHLDSVRDAGKYDGPLGVLVAIEAVQRLRDHHTRFPFAIEVLAFADEEGLRFGTTYLGSRAMVGRLGEDDLRRTDAEGVTMAEAIRRFGGDPARVGDDRWQGERPLGYIEVHIEQGPVLESLSLPVGVVSAIAGQSRFEITVTGEAGHAGTVPMDRRHDALIAASEVVLAVDGLARKDGLMVATVGKLQVEPGAANVIPGRVVLSLDVRHPIDAVREEASRAMIASARDTAARRGVGVEVRAVSDRAAVACSPGLIAILLEAAGPSAVQLPSGAGHDAVYMSELTDIGMLFVRCKRGISHHPAESVEVGDVVVAIDVLGRCLESLARE